VWESEPLVPVTVTVYDPAIPLQDSVEDCDEPRVTLVGLKEQMRPPDDTTRERFTVPVNPLTGEIIIAEMAFAPEITVTLVGLALMLKS